jgi:hypothetical protein
MIKLLSKYMDKIDWKILLSMNEDKTFNIIAAPVPKVKDEALKDMNPVIIKRMTLEELDDITSDSLNKAMAGTQSLVSNVAEFEKGVEASAKLTKMVKEKREATKKKDEKDKKAAKDSAPSMFEKAKPSPIEEPELTQLEEVEKESNGEPETVEEVSLDI